MVNSGLEMPNLSHNLRFFIPCELDIWRDDIEKQQGTSSLLRQALSIIS